MIYDLDLGSPGSFSDASTWRTSMVKPILEQQHPLFQLAGDSGYPRSKMLIASYTVADSANNLGRTSLPFEVVRSTN